MTWYVRRASGESGPFTDQEIVKRIADGNIRSEAMIRKAPSTEWSPIAQSEFSDAFDESNPYRNPTPLTSKPSLWRYPVAAGASICLVTLVAAGLGNSPEESGKLIGEFIGRAIGVSLLWGIVSLLLRWIRPRESAQPTVASRVGSPFALAMVLLALGALVLFTQPRVGSASDLPGFRTGLINGCVKKSGDERRCRAMTDCVVNELRSRQRGDAELAKWISTSQRDPTVQRQVESTIKSCAQEPIVAEPDGGP